MYKRNKLADADYLQEDLDKLAEWEGKWKITFHPDKCNVLTIACKRRRSSLYHF
jgi:hypothetical protein